MVHLVNTTWFGCRYKALFDHILKRTYNGKQRTRIIKLELGNLKHEPSYVQAVSLAQGENMIQTRNYV